VKDLTEIPDKVKDGLSIVPIETIEEAMKYIFPIKSRKDKVGNRKVNGKKKRKTTGF
jgi:ATP-dependent Lon protease